MFSSLLMKSRKSRIFCFLVMAQLRMVIEISHGRPPFSRICFNIRVPHRNTNTIVHSFVWALSFHYIVYYEVSALKNRIFSRVAVRFTASVESSIAQGRFINFNSLQLSGFILDTIIVLFTLENGEFHVEISFQFFSRKSFSICFC